MTQEDKELLLKDLYARIPYGVKGCCESETLHTTPLHWYAEHTLEYSVNYMVIKNEWRPYLFPLSSMPEEQKKELNNTLISLSLKALSDEINSEVVATYEVDFYNKNHFDYRGLIPKGLAIDATGLNVY